MVSAFLNDYGKALLSDDKCDRTKATVIACIKTIIDFLDEFIEKNKGNCKIKRIQRVYLAFLEAFVECYRIYMDYMEGRKYEADYGALSVNLQGKAITYDNYYQKFSMDIFCWKII